MEFLHLLEGLRTPLGERIFGIITYLGSDIMMIVTLCALLWICGRRAALRLAIAYAGSGLVNQLLKVAFAVPRPWVLDERLTPAESALAGATGYSFPSGHSQTAACLFTSLALMFRRRWVAIVGATAIAAVMLSRMYLGVHTPLDVIVGCALSVVATLVINRLLNRAERSPHYMRGVFIGGTAGSLMIAAICFAQYMAGEPANMLKDLIMVAGALCGFAIGMYLDSRHEEKLLPLRLSLPLSVAGLAIVFALKQALGAALAGTPGELWQSMLKYGLITYYIAGIHPALMRAAGRCLARVRHDTEV